MVARLFHSSGSARTTGSARTDRDLVRSCTGRVLGKLHQGRGSGRSRLIRESLWWQRVLHHGPFSWFILVHRDRMARGRHGNQRRRSHSGALVCRFNVGNVWLLLGPEPVDRVGWVLERGSKTPTRCRYDKNADIAIFRIVRPTATYFTTSNSRTQLRIGDAVNAIGYRHADL